MSHYLGNHGASIDPNGRFRTTVKISSTAPSPHIQTGARAIRTGLPLLARTIQTSQRTAKTA